MSGALSHRLELALKDAVKEVLKPVDTSLYDLYYICTKYSKKNKELKNLFNLLEGQSYQKQKMKATSNSQIDHKICAMGCVIEKRGLYTKHLQNVTLTGANVKARATLEGKYAKLVDQKVLLAHDVLAETKSFSLKTQKIDVSIIDVVQAVKNTKQNYQQLLKHLEKGPALILKLPTLKLITDLAEANEDDEPH